MTYRHVTSRSASSSISRLQKRLPEEVVDADLLADIECPGVAAVEFLHSSRQAAVADLQDQVVVVPHQAIRDDLSTRTSCDLGSEDE